MDIVILQLLSVVLSVITSFTITFALNPDLVKLVAGQNATETEESNIIATNRSIGNVEESDYIFGNYDEEIEDFEIDEEILREFADLDFDDFGMLFRGRWSYAPGFVEKLCLKKCQEAGKHFGRLLGVKCSCYCPLNAAELDLCSTTGYCDKFCASLKFYKGGDCVYNNVCFCYCKPGDEYNVYNVYTLEGPSTTPETTTTTTTTTTAAPSTNSTKVLTNGGRPGRPRPRPRPQRKFSFGYL